MSEPLTYEFQMTPEFARAAAPLVAQALWIQNERLYHHWEGRMSHRSLLRKVGIAFCLAATVLTAWAWSQEPRNRFFEAFFVVYSVLLVVFIYLPQLGRALRWLTRRILGWNARRTMEQVAKRAPYTIKYELSEHALETHAEKLKFSSALDLRRVRVAVVTTNFVCLFAHPQRQKLLRVLYVPGPRQHAAVCAALAGNGAEMRRLGAE